MVTLVLSSTAAHPTPAPILEPSSLSLELLRRLSRGSIATV